MSRKDFELIAQVLKEQKASLPLVEAMADKLKHTNPRFDKVRFILAAYHGDLKLSSGNAR